MRNADVNAIPRGLIAAVGLAMLALMCGGAWFYLDQQRLVRKATETELQATAMLKANQIAEWRSTQIRRAAVVMESPFFSDAVAQWIAEPKPDRTRKLLVRLRSMQEHFHYRDVTLADGEGRVLLSLGNRVDSLHTEAAHAVALALKEHRTILTDLHIGPGDLPPHVDVIAPLFTGNGTGAEPVGALVLQIDAARFLYPMIQGWPTPSRTAETLLVRRDGDAVLFLNELRHKSGTALKLRIPLEKKDVPAVEAVLGQEGIVEGKDYRGVAVLSVLLPIPDSPWFIVAKTDVAEALAVWKYRSILIVAFLMALMTLVIASGAMIWQRNAKASYRKLYDAEVALRRIEERYRITLASIGDGVLATDTTGRVVFLNRVAEALMGWTQEEACGKPVEEVFCIVNELTRQPVANPVSRALQAGVVVGLANHTLLIARDGTERPIADSGAPIRDQDGIVSGVVLVFRDQTEERDQQKRLQVEKERAQQYLDVAGVIMIVLDPEGTVELINRKGCEVLGFTEAEITGKNWFGNFLPERDRERMHSAFSLIMAGETELVPHFENAVRTRTGEERILAWKNSLLTDAAGKIVGSLSSGEDITERKYAEEKQKQLTEEMQRFTYIVSHDLRAPLSNINGFSRELRSAIGVLGPIVERVLPSLPDEERKKVALTLREDLPESLNFVNSSVTQMNHLIERILQLSRVGRMELVFQPLDMNALVASVLDTFAHELQTSRSTVHVADLPEIKADRTAMEQIMGNLIGNAIKYSDPDRLLEIRITAHRFPDETVFVVRDTGSGVEELDLSRIFHVFQRAAKQDVPGEGMGLASVRTLVRRHGGRIWCESEPGEGARFTFTICSRLGEESPCC
jgi:PAS domain S-box-containing protein